LYKLQVEKMSCTECVARITRTLQIFDPRAKVGVLLSEKLVQVTSTEASEAVAAAISAAGIPHKSLPRRVEQNHFKKVLI
jgi:copper chaperone CopZ